MQLCFVFFCRYLPFAAILWCCSKQVLLYKSDNYRLDMLRKWLHILLNIKILQLLLSDRNSSDAGFWQFVWKCLNPNILLRSHVCSFLPNFWHTFHLKPPYCNYLMWSLISTRDAPTLILKSMILKVLISLINKIGSRVYIKIHYILKTKCSTKRVMKML